MKSWPYIAIGIIVLIIIGALMWQDRDRLGLAKFFGSVPGAASSSGDSSTQAVSPADATQPASVTWRTVNRKDDGFKVEMPSGTKDGDAPAVNESGGTELVKMLSSSLDSDTTYAVTWADNPPVARANANNPDRTLDQARDGMLASSQTALVSETRITVSGFPGREIFAHNAAGGVLNARLIFVPNGSSSRLYTLMALFPTAGARSESDVVRFFNSFKPDRQASKG